MKSEPTTGVKSCRERQKAGLPSKVGIRCCGAVDRQVIGRMRFGLVAKGALRSRRLTYHIGYSVAARVEITTVRWVWEKSNHNRNLIDSSNRFLRSGLESARTTIREIRARESTAFARRPRRTYSEDSSFNMTVMLGMLAFVLSIGVQ
jgi:hypothetical protein